jgi:hypothetical protein
VRAHGAVAGHRGKQLVAALGEHPARTVLPEVRKQRLGERLDVSSRERPRDRAHDDRRRRERGHLEAERRERRAVLFERRDVRRVGMEGHRDQELLCAGRGGVERRLQLLVQDSLVRRVHVDEHQPGAVLREDIHAVQLGDGKSERLLRLGGRGFRDAAVGPDSRALEHRTIRGDRLRDAERRLERLRTRDEPVAGERGSGHRDRRRAGRAGKRARGSMEHELMHRPRVAETDLGLGRMHVDVDGARVDLDEHRVRRVAVAVQHVRVRFAQRVREQAVAHEPAVDEHVLRVAPAACLIGRAEIAAHPQSRDFRVQCPRGTTEAVAEDGADPDCVGTCGECGSPGRRGAA